MTPSICRRVGKKADLTAREFALLQYLLRKKAKLVTRRMILADST